MFHVGFAFKSRKKGCSKYFAFHCDSETLHSVGCTSSTASGKRNISVDFNNTPLIYIKNKGNNINKGALGMDEMSEQSYCLESRISCAAFRSRSMNYTEGKSILHESVSLQYFPFKLWMFSLVSVLSLPVPCLISCSKEFPL